MLFLLHNYIKMSIIKKLRKYPKDFNKEDLDDSGATSEVIAELDDIQKKEFQKMYDTVMNYLKGDFFFHPEMDIAIDLMLPEDKKEKDTIKHEWFHTVAHNVAYLHTHN